MAADINFRSRRLNVSAVPGDGFSFTVTLENLGFLAAPAAVATFGAVTAATSISYSDTTHTVTILVTLSAAQTTTLGTTQVQWTLVVTPSGGDPRTFLAGDYVGDPDPIKTTPRAAHRIVPYDSVGTVTVIGGGIAGSGDLLAANNLSDVASTDTARSNLEAQRAQMLDARDFGVVADGVTDDTDDIISALAAGLSQTATVYFPAGTSIVSAPLAVSCSIASDVSAEWAFTSAVTSTAVTIAEASVGVPLQIALPHVTRSGGKLWGPGAILTDVGVAVLELVGSLVVIREITDFSIGLSFRPATAANAHNVFTIALLYDNAVNLDISPTGAAWVNDNTYHLQQSGYDSGLGSNVADVRHIRISTASNIPNNHRFIGGSIEGDTAEYEIECAGLYNLFLGMRFENTGGGKVWYRDTGSYNMILGGYETESVSFTEDAGAGNNLRLASFDGDFGASADGLIRVANPSSSAYPTVSVYEASATPIANRSSEWTIGVGGSNLEFKRPADSFPQLAINANSGSLTWVLGTVLSEAAADVVSSSGAFKPASYTTAGRPSASAFGAGAQVWDSDLATPIWSNGSSWVAAAAGSGDLVSTNNLSDVANAATSLSNLGGQPLDSDLTAIAALTTTTFGRSLLELANAAALRTAGGLVIGTDVQAYSSVLAATTASFTTADESKLDAIEAGATADQSAAEILAALLTVDGAGSGLDADLLDGQSSAAFESAGAVTTHAGATDPHGDRAYADGLAANYQPVDSDLTAIAALTTTSFGRSVLEAANAAALRTLAGTVIGTDVQAYDANLTTWAGKTAPSGTVVGTSDSQTLTNKTVTTPTLTLKQSATPTPTAEGDIQWDTDDNRIVVGDGAATKVFSDDSVVQARANHTGTQTASTISDFSTAVAGESVGGDLTGTVSNAQIAAGAVGATELATDAVTNAKVADDAIGIAELSATGTPDSTTFLRGDNTWAAGGGGLANVVEDTTPQLGGNLDLNGFVITGLVIGTNVQAYDADLAAIAGLTSAADKGIQFTGSGTAATFDLTAAGKALLDDANAAAQRTTLGLGSLATLSTITSSEITDGTIVNADVSTSAAIALTKLADVYSASLNFGIGPGVLGVITTGDDNVGVGYQALSSLTEGNSNIGVGDTALGAVTTGSNNVGLGRLAGKAITTGGNNFAMGTFSLFTETTGTDHIGIGNQSLFAVTGAIGDVGIGSNAGINVTSGSYNTMIGFRAWDAAGATTGSYNTVIGADADQSGSAISNATAIGATAVVGGDYAVSIGYAASATGAGSMAIGTDSGGTAASTSTANEIKLGTANHTATLLGKMSVGGVGSYGGGGTGVVSILNAGTVPSSDPTGGGVLYAEGGALKWRGSSGTVTTIAAA